MLRTAGVVLVLAGLVPASSMARPHGASTEPGPSQEAPTPIAEVRMDADGDFVPDRLGDTVTVAGRATVETSRLDRERTRLFIQDATGGIPLFAMAPGDPVAPGDSVVATGTVGHFRGLTQIEVTTYRTVPGAPRPPEPIELPADHGGLEALEGSLVRATVFVRGSGGHQWGTFLRVGPADGTETTLTVYVHRTHGDPPVLQRFSAGDEIEVTGLLGQHDVDPPHDASYELYPRSPDDLRAAGFPRRLLQRGLAWTIALLALAGVGLLVLRRQVRRRTRALAESERRSRESGERLSVLLDHAPVALWTVDRDLEITWAEGRGLVDLGRGDGDLVGTTIPEMFGPDHEALHAYGHALAGEPARFDVEWGGRMWEVRLQPLREEGEVTGIVGAALDATGHREAERRLEEQSAYFQKLFDESPEAIVLVDEDDRILQVNPEFEAMFGYAGDEAVDRPVNELISVPGREKEATDLTRRVASGERLQVETVRRHKDGTPIDVSILATRLEVGGRRRVYGIYRDVTERRALEAQLLHSQRLEAVGQLAGGVAHDFNNILTAILGHARVLLEDLEDLEDGDRRREDLRQIVAAGERAARLTRQLLTFSRRDMAAPRSVDLNTVIRDTRAFLGRLIEERIELAVELADGLPPVRADPGQLEQIVVNLVLNARDAMPAGGHVTLSTRHVSGLAEHPAAGGVGSGARAPAGPAETNSGPPETKAGPPVDADESRWVVLAVRDAGRGMSPDERARMFEPFFTTKGPGEGTGLGLSTVYGIVEQAGGFIDVDTSPGVGTTVSIHLPACAESPAPTAAPSGAGAGDPSDDPAARAEELVLLVDDDRPVRDVARRILERAGYRVVALGSGGAALDHLDRSGLVPDAVVTDIVMPGMTGYELANRLRERFPGIRVLLMTGYTEEEPGTRGDYPEILRKPFDAITLVDRLRDTLTAP